MSAIFDSSSSSATDSPSKRSREESELPEDMSMDEAAKAKVARKEARVSIALTSASFEKANHLTVSRSSETENRHSDHVISASNTSPV